MSCQGHGGVGHFRVVLEEREIQRPTVAPAVDKSAILAHPLHDKPECGFGPCQPFRLIEHRAGLGQGGDHQAVPISQHLIVASRPDTLRSG